MATFSSPPDAPGGSSSSSVSYSAANSITSAGTYSGKTYKSTTANQNSVLISSSGTVKLANPTVTKSGDSDGGDNCNFYGINSAVMALGGGTVSISGGSVTATAKGANGVFSYGGNGGTNGAAGDGTTVIISNTTIKTMGDNGGGIMTTGGGVMKASNLTITTTGNSSAPIRTDRGGGSVTVSGGSYTSSGVGSPAIYSTADIVVSDASLTSNHSEGVCIEGQNSVALTDCTLSVTNDSINGNAQFSDAIMIYQSQSGDAASGTSTFSMTGGTLNNYKGHLLHVTNTAAVISLNGVTINDSGDGVLLSVCDDGWSGASNIATLNASNQNLTGDILVGSDSTLTLNISDSSTFTGNILGSITNASGTKISSSLGTVNVSLDSTSKWYLTGDTYISDFDGTAANVITGGYTLYVNNSALDGTSETDSSATTLIITNSSSATVTVGSAIESVDASARTKTLRIYANSLDNTINGGSGKDIVRGADGNDSILGNAGNDVLYGEDGSDTLLGGTGDDTLKGGDGNDKLYGQSGNDYLLGGSGADTLSGGDGNDSILGSAGKDKLYGGNGTDTLYGGDNNDILYGQNGNDYLNGGAGNDKLFGGDGTDKLYGSTGKDSLFGGAENDTLKGGDGNDYLSGGTGNDKLWGGDGADTFYYASGDGKDVIYGFSDEDSLTLDGLDFTSSYHSSTGALVIKVTGGSVTFRDFDAQTFNINGASYEISGKKLVAK